MMRILFLITAFTFVFNPASRAQQQAVVPGEYLVSFHGQTNPEMLLQQLDPSARVMRVSELLNVWQVNTPLPSERVLPWLYARPEVRMAQQQHLLEHRAMPDILPNDPLIPQQWHLQNLGLNGGTFDADLDAELAWEFATGGVSPAGDTIVVAVIDDGLDTDHPDLKNNLWYNWAEKPDNGVDDDQNGYTDDFAGWNVFLQNDNIQGNSIDHGTPVCGILGAEGNNAIGGSGVAWTIKMMFVAASGTESQILSAYDYIWKARKAYNQSFGEEGSLVVAVNCSFGINFGQPDQSPIWCAAFDTLGAAGIVSVAATANLNINVDEMGDLPTACPSQYLISVTSLDRNDFKAENAAWGATSIDLGAYGKDVLTCNPTGGYEWYSGTSFAAPQVAGGIGLLYTAPCPSLISLALTNPEEAAYWAKSLLLENVTPNPSLDGKTTTNGHLNLHWSLRNYQLNCGTCPPPFAIKADSILNDSMLISWAATSATFYTRLRYRPLGLGSWMVLENVSAPVWIGNLVSCLTYEVELQSICDKGVESAWSPPRILKTRGCCTIPEAVWLASAGDDNAVIAWTPVSDNVYYRTRYKRADTPIWQYAEVNTPYALLSQLDPCTHYQTQVQTWCGKAWTPFSPVFAFTTGGCGACTALEYCSSNTAESAEEWIQSVSIGPWSFVSGPGGNGFQNFTGDLSEGPALPSASFLPVEIVPGFSGGANKEFFRLYIDFNQDGDFDDDMELAFDPGFALETTASGILHIPETLTPGYTRMRVMMKFAGPNEDAPDACELFEFGQVEDYCAALYFDSTFTAAPEVYARKNGLYVFPQPVADQCVIQLPDAAAAGNWDVRLLDMNGRSLRHFSATPAENGVLHLQGLQSLPQGVYRLRIGSGLQVMDGQLIKTSP